VSRASSNFRGSNFGNSRFGGSNFSNASFSGASRNGGGASRFNHTRRANFGHNGFQGGDGGFSHVGGSGGYDRFGGNGFGHNRGGDGGFGHQGFGRGDFARGGHGYGRFGHDRGWYGRGGYGGRDDFWFLGDLFGLALDFGTLAFSPWSPLGFVGLDLLNTGIQAIGSFDQNNQQSYEDQQAYAPLCGTYYSDENPGCQEQW
jgi:hypothetical protein